MIRKAEERDIPRIMELLGQVLQIHADIRPDIFIPGTTKYTADELKELLKNKEKPIYIAVICPLSSRQVKYLKVSDKNTYISFWSVGIFMHTISLYIF